MRVWMDTEFTDFFVDLEMISIGMVAEDGREFYAELSTFDTTACNDFVRSTVLPLLGKSPEAICTSREELKARLEAWWRSFNEEVTLMYDCFTDYALLMDLFSNQLPWNASGSVAIEKKLDQAKLESYFSEEGVLRHHALHDARANRFAFISSPRPRP